MHLSLTRVPESLIEIHRRFFHSGFDLRLVGGPVRDLVRGSVPKDWDCCVDCPPETTMQILEDGGYKPFDMSNGHGTITCHVDGIEYEITTLRIDVETDGRHAEVEWTNDFREDALRRDFTVNAMSMSLINGWVYDYFDGVNDLETKTLRFVGEPSERIKEDYLRILRYFRFMGKLGFDKVHRPSYKAICQLKSGLDHISGERVWSEMQQIFCDPNHERLIHLMRESGVLRTLGLERQ